MVLAYFPSANTTLGVFGLGSMGSMARSTSQSSFSSDKLGVNTQLLKKFENNGYLLQAKLTLLGDII